MAESVYIENIVHTHVDEATAKSLETIADSLKRIADVMDGTKVVEEEREKVRAELWEEMRPHCSKCNSESLEAIRYHDPCMFDAPVIAVHCKDCGHIEKYIDDTL